MILHLMEVPAKLWGAVASGKAEVIGSLVKRVADGQVIGQLQPSKLAANALLMANPEAAMLKMVAEIGLQATANVQLHQLKGMIESLRLVTELGAAASVLNLGVSIGGFALVLSKLQTLETKIDQQSSRLQEIGRALDTSIRARGYAALGRAEEAFSLDSEQQSIRFWSEAEHELDFLVQHSFQRLFGAGLHEFASTSAGSSQRLALASSLSSDDSLDATQWLLNCAGARVETLLCLREPRAAGRVAAQVADWLGRMGNSAQDIARARIAGRLTTPTVVRGVANDAQRIENYFSKARAVFRDRSYACDLYAKLNVDTRQYVIDAHNHPEPTLLFLDTSGEYSS
jgi:hypothetical protein